MRNFLKTLSFVYNDVYSPLLNSVLVDQSSAKTLEEKTAILQKLTTDQLITIYDEIMWKFGQVKSGIDLTLLKRVLEGRGVDLRTHVNPLLKAKPKNLSHYLYATTLTICGGIILAVIEYTLGQGILKEGIFLFVFITFFLSAFLMIHNPQGNVVWAGINLFLILGSIIVICVYSLELLAYIFG